MGNICRSPAGEAVFRAYAERQAAGAPIEVDSAGTIDYHAGCPADPRMRDAAARRGYALTGAARQVCPGDVEAFDLIVAMDRANLLDLEALAGGPRPHIRMLGSFLDGADSNRSAADVPDPYYGGDAGFERVIEMIEAACPRLFKHLTATERTA